MGGYSPEGVRSGGRGKSAGEGGMRCSFAFAAGGAAGTIPFASSPVSTDHLRRLTVHAKGQNRLFPLGFDTGMDRGLAGLARRSYRNEMPASGV